MGGDGSGAVKRGCNEGTFYESTFYESIFYESTFYESTFYESTFYESTLHESTFYESTFYESALYESVLYESTFFESTWFGCDRQSRGDLTLVRCVYMPPSLQMFCGIVDSSRTSAVALYDLRSTAGAVRKLRAAANQQQPVHSVCHTAEDELLCATMGGVWAWGGGTKGGDPAPSESGDREEPVAEQLQIQVKRSEWHDD